jgi:hypothetical protein
VDATAAISLPGKQGVATASRKGVFERVGLKHDQTVDVVVQYPGAKVGRTIIAEPLDGGKVIVAAKRLVVAADGTIHFKFCAGHDVGSYQVALHDAAQKLGLQFWVLDEQHPDKNPPEIHSVD